MKKKIRLALLISIPTLLVIAGLIYLFLFLKPFSDQEEISEFDSVYISDNADSTQLQINSETTIETDDSINPSKQGELTVDENRKVITFKKDLTEEEISILEKNYNIEFTSDQSINSTYSIITNDDSNLEDLEKDDNIDTLETDIPVQMFSDTIDWGVVRIGANKVWSSGSGSGVKVAVIDTGIQLTHSDLTSNILSGYDFVNNDSNPTDDNGHGTHVAGIIASTMNGTGNVGASYSAKLMPIKVLNESGYGYLSDVAKGVYYAADNGARVINMSLGTTYDSDTLRRAIQYASNKGVLVVAAAGNEYGSPCSYPAAYSSVICVVATDQYNKLASFSNIGGELAAPGVSNYSTYINNSYAKLSGTSMASPHIAGSAALLMSICTDCSTSEIRNTLRDTAIDLGAQDYDIIFGYGLVNLVDAVNSLNTNEEEPTDNIDEPTDETTPETDSEYQESNQGEDDEIQNRHQTPPSQITLEITSPETNSTKRYILRKNEDILLKFEISPETTTVSKYKIYLNNEEVDDYDGVTKEYLFDIDDMDNSQYQLRVEALLENNTVISDSILLDLTHLSRGRSVKGVSDFRNWLVRLFFN